MLLEFLKTVQDHRRPQGRVFDLPHAVLFVILARVAGANSWPMAHAWIKEHFPVLKKHFRLFTWWRCPSQSGLWTIFNGMDAASLEGAFRAYSAKAAREKQAGCTVLACDGKELRGSFDTARNQRAAQVLSVFARDERLILAHVAIPEKTNEIPEFQKLIAALGLKGKLFTLDAMHAQKKRFKR